jgi:hypothetical protein
MVVLGASLILKLTKRSKKAMTEAEALHRRKMQLKNDIVKPLVTLIDRGIDVKDILQNLIINNQDIVVDKKHKQSHC